MVLYVNFNDMYYYFTSKNDCALKLNGIYLGLVSKTIKHVNILSEKSLVEIVSLNGSLPSLSFVLDDNLLTNPPLNLSVTDMKGGYLISYIATPVSLPFKVIEQKKFSDLVITVFCDNGYKISIETNTDFFTESLDCQVLSTQIERKGDLLLVGINGDIKAIFGYQLTPKICPVIKKSCNDFCFENTITTTHEYCDIAKHKTFITWEIKNNSLCPRDKQITYSPNFSINNLPAKIIPYAFLEELLVGGVVDDYLDTTIKPNADKLRGFFGNFIGVMPPPFFVSPEQIGLIYKKNSNQYYVEYCSFELNGRLISGIKK